MQHKFFFAHCLIRSNVSSMQLEVQALSEELSCARADRERLSQELQRTAVALSEERSWAEKLLSKLEPYLEAERSKVGVSFS